MLFILLITTIFRLLSDIVIRNCDSVFKKIAKAIGVPKMADPPGREFRGSPLVAMYNAPSPWKTPEFPIVYPSDDHVILYEISQRGFDNGPPDARVGRDLWDSEHVRMPHSSQSLLETSKKYSFISTSTRRWETIEKALSKKIRNSQDLAKAILTYNTKFEYIWKFEAMHKFFDEFTDAEYFFKHTLPAMVRLALDLPKLVQMPIPLLKMGMNKSISLSQLQIACLLANAFFCTYPRRNSTYPAAEFGSYPRINFTSLYERIDLDNVQQKLMCIIHYFTRVCSDMPKGVVTFSRRSMHPKGCPHWDKSNTLIADIPLHADHKATIEDALGMIQVDFANKFLGGGILGRGCVQEEIRFLVCPEMMVSMLFSEKMDANEAVLVIGCERYCNYTGYGSRNFKFSGDHRDPTPVDGSGRKRCAILAIDAVLYRNPAEQFRKNMILRELNKAWVGFSFHTDPRSPVLEYPGVATGNWGCGAFGGSPQLKALVQLMAAAQARRPLGYFTFGDVHLRNEVAEAHNMMKIHNVTVGQLFKQLKKYCKSDRNIHLYKYIEDALVRKSHKPQHGGTTRHNQQVNDSSPESSESEDEPIEEELINFSQEESPGIYSGNQQPQYSEQLKKKQKPHGSNSGNQKTSSMPDYLTSNSHTSGHSSHKKPSTPYDDEYPKLNSGKPGYNQNIPAGNSKPCVPHSSTGNSHTSGHSSHKKPSYNDTNPKLDLCIPEHKQNTAAGNSKPSVSHSIAYNQSNAPAPPPGFTPHGTSHATPTGNWSANYVPPSIVSGQRETGAIGSHLPPLASDLLLPYGNMAGSSHNLTASHHKPTVPPRIGSKHSTSNISNNHAATFITNHIEAAAPFMTRTVSSTHTKESYQSSAAAPMEIDELAISTATRHLENNPAHDEEATPQYPQLNTPNDKYIDSSMMTDDDSEPEQPNNNAFADAHVDNEIVQNRETVTQSCVSVIQTREMVTEISEAVTQVREAATQATDSLVQIREIIAQTLETVTQAATQTRPTERDDYSTNQTSNKVVPRPRKVFDQNRTMFEQPSSTQTTQMTEQLQDLTRTNNQSTQSLKYYNQSNSIRETDETENVGERKIISPPDNATQSEETNNEFKQNKNPDISDTITNQTAERTSIRSRDQPNIRPSTAFKVNNDLVNDPNQDKGDQCKDESTKEKKSLGTEPAKDTVEPEDNPNQYRTLFENSRSKFSGPSDPVSTHKLIRKSDPPKNQYLNNVVQGSNLTGKADSIAPGQGSNDPAQSSNEAFHGGNTANQTDNVADKGKYTGRDNMAPVFKKFLLE